MIEQYKPPTGICECGRSMLPSHCRSCGSTNLYGRKKFAKTIRIPPQIKGEEPRDIVVKNFNCRKCASEFFDDEECKAPKLIHRITREEAQMARAATLRPSTSLDKDELGRLVSHIRELAKEQNANSDFTPTVLSNLSRSSPIDEQEPPPELFDSPELSQEEQEEFEKWQKGE